MLEKDLSDKVIKISQVGLAKSKQLNRLGIETVEDLLTYIPKEIIDLTQTSKISEVVLGKKVLIKANVGQMELKKTFRRGFSVLRGLLSDSSGSIEAVWFNQAFLQNVLKAKRNFLFYAETKIDKYSGRLILQSPEVLSHEGIYPIYRLTEGVTSRQIVRYIKNALDAGYLLKEFLPDEIVKKEKLIKMENVAKFLHMPKTRQDFLSAKRRIIFNQLLFLIGANIVIKKSLKAKKGYKISYSKSKLNEMIDDLPFKLTTDQAITLEQVLKDMGKETPMNRIVQGDVGCGKTIIALLASLAVIENGQKAVWLAPTQVLANQHFATAKKFFKNKKIKLISAKEKNKDTENFELIIGTHALLYLKKKINNLGLIVVDEQHRFGVKQRQQLQSSKQKMIPHFLSMTATPIPRTLSHIVFGNLDISIIATKPKGRQKVKTYLIPEEKRTASYDFIKKLIEKNQKAFVVCPAIDEGSELKAVKKEYENLNKSILGDYKILMLHGKMKQQEKENAFEEFANGDGQILLSTSIIEIGVDVSEATVIIIEDAHNFGLAQLHQFRGRVGRGEMQSYCFCFSNDLDNENSKSRLKAFVRNDDGFVLAELDFKQRGPGALTGLEQTGFSQIKPYLFEDMELLRKTQKIAHQIVDQSNKQSYLMKKINKLIKTFHLE